MKPEYIAKIGNLFVHQIFMFADQMSLTPKQHDATRFDKDGIVKWAQWAKLYELPCQIVCITGQKTLMVSVDKLLEDVPVKEKV